MFFGCNYIVVIYIFDKYILKNVKKIARKAYLRPFLPLRADDLEAAFDFLAGATSSVGGGVATGSAAAGSSVVTAPVVASSALAAS